MLRLFKRKEPAAPAVLSKGASLDDCRRLLHEHIDYITKICEKAASGGYASSPGQGRVLAGEGGHCYTVERSTTLDPDDLFVQVLDHLQEDDFRRLRGFEGRSSFTTYLTTIISRFVVDLIRSRSGRSRAKERAAKLGDLGERTYDLMVLRGHSAAEASDIMLTSFGQRVSPDELRTLHDSLLGRETRHHSTVESSTAWGEEGELVVIQAANPESRLSDRVQRQRRRELLAAVMEKLKGDDRLLLRLRFPLDEATEPLELPALAAMLGLSERQADRRLRRILLDCRVQLLEKGFNLDDLS